MLLPVPHLKPEAEAGFRAELRGLNLYDLVQLECSRGERRRRVLRVMSAGHMGYLFFDGAQISHATTGRLVGEPAVMEMLAWTSGTLREVEYAWPERPTVHTNWQGLLMRAAQILDEARRGPDFEGSVTRLASRERTEESFADVVTLGISGPNPEAEAESMASSELRAVRLAANGDVVRHRGDVEDLAQAASFVAHVASRVADSLGLDRFVALDWACATNRTLLYADGAELVAVEGERSLSTEALRGATRL